MKKLFPILLIALGVAFLGAGGYASYRGFDARDQVRTELVAQNITTPDDASMPGVLVDDVASAKSMAAIIDTHARESSDGLTYAQMGRFMTPNGDPAGTNVEAEAVVGGDGRPVANPMRNSAFQASALRTSLFSSVMAFEVATLVIGIGALLVALGFAIGGVGIALAGLALPKLARYLHVEPVALPAD